MRWFVGFVAVIVSLAPFSSSRADDRLVSRIVFGSCANQNNPCPIWERIPEQKPDLLLLIGDNMYADIEDSRLKPATPEKIAQCYAAVNALPAFQALRKLAPMLGTWDDHDYGNNDAGVEWEHKAIAQKLFLDFFQVPEDSPRRQQKGIYHAEIFGPPGKRVQIIMLDTRYFRSPLKYGEAQSFPPYGLIRRPYMPNTDEKATFLGEAQWKWLEEQLRQPAELRILGSSIQVVSEDHPFEKWTNIPAERDRLYQLIQSTGATGVMAISGDRHLGELSLDPSRAGYPFYDLTSSGLNQASKNWRLPEPNRHRVAAMPYGDNFGLITIDWNAADPMISLELRDDKGEIAVRHPVPLSALKPRGSAVALKLPEGVISATEALKKVGETVTVQFRVEAGRTFPGQRILLNSEPDFRSPKNFTVVLNAKAMTGPWETATFETFQGQMIRAKGTVTEYRGSAQLQLDDPTAIEIVKE